MRQRRIKDIDKKLDAYADLLLPSESGTPYFEPESADTNVRREPAAALKSEDRTLFSALSGFESKSTNTEGLHELVGQRSRWYERIPPRYILPEGCDRIYVELGCGRGKFINALAEKDQDDLFIGVEGCQSVIIKALIKTEKASLTNVKYIDNYINDTVAAFGEEILDGIFLNFSDPWPKDRHEGRRLTTQKRAEGYFRSLKPGGFAAVKTDNEALFDYSLEAFKAAGFCLEYITRNLHESVPEIEISVSDPKGIAVLGAYTPTEYEQKFKTLGKPIYYAYFA